MSGGKEQCKVGNNTCNIEWNVVPAKVKMNEMSTPATVDWILKDNATGSQLIRESPIPKLLTHNSNSVVKLTGRT